MFVYKSMGRWIRLAERLARGKTDAEPNDPTRAGKPVSPTQECKEKSPGGS